MKRIKKNIYDCVTPHFNIYQGLVNFTVQNIILNI